MAISTIPAVVVAVLVAAIGSALGSPLLAVVIAVVVGVALWAGVSFSAEHLVVARIGGSFVDDDESRERQIS